jgi:glucose-1-phosphate cytidylyltransferase
MKVVLFCGGLGTRLREHSDTVPKALVNIGSRPLIWHLMRYYAHYGHKEFVLCLGYRGDMIRDYFLGYSDAQSTDFTLHGLGTGGKVELHGQTLSDWKITFVDTGLHSNIGERLIRARPFLNPGEPFLANYADGLSDLPLDLHIAKFLDSDAVATFAAVRSSQSFHAVQLDDDMQVTGIGEMGEQHLLINGGYFVFRPSIFDHIQPGEELVERPFGRLIEQRRLQAYPWKGFWKAMDTFKDKISFDRMEARGECPWAVWRLPG